MLVCVTFGLLFCPAQGLRPNPEIQTRIQKVVWSNKAILAASLSLNATPSLLDHLGSRRSRTLLEKDCPHLANATSKQILSRLLAELRVSELIQSLGAGQYQTMPQLFETNFLYNLWEAQFNFTKPVCERSENNNEKEIFGLPPFTHCPPRSWTEAQNRLYYVSLNYQKLPMGFVFYDLSLAFNRTYARNLTLIAPIDTGCWRSRCVSHHGHPNSINCTAWNRTVGTLSDLNHLFLAAYYLQNGPTSPSAFFPRIDCVTAANHGGGTRIIGNGVPYSQISQFPYFESNIVGSINFPSGVSHVLAPFQTYWGTNTGRSLQAWCRRWGFPLLWAYCKRSSHYKCSDASRLIDPELVNATRINVTASSTVVAETAHWWRVVLQLPDDDRTTALRDAWGNLSSLASASDEPTSLLTRALSAGDCGQPDWCIGMELRTSMDVTSGGRCICRM